MHQGACGKVGNAFPSPPPLAKKIRYKVGPRGVNFFVLKPKWDLEGWLLFMRHGSRAAQRRTATASLLELHAPPHRHPPADHSACAGDRPWLGRAITCHSTSAMLSRYPQRPAPGSIPAQADAGRGLLHARALLPAQDLGKVRRASRHCNLLPWLHPCIARLTPFLSRGIVLFSLSCIFFRCLAFASRSLLAQGRSKGRKIKSGL